MHGFEPTTAELVETYKPLLTDPDQAVRNRAAESVLFKIQMRERWEDHGGGLYGFHTEYELRQILETAVTENRVTAPSVIGWFEKHQEAVAKVREAFRKAMAQQFTTTVGVDGLLILHAIETESDEAPDRSSEAPLPPNP